MRADIMKWCASKVTARCAVLLILASDLEACNNITGATVGRGRGLKSLQTYNSKITRATMERLINEGFVERVGFNFRLKGKH